MLTNVNDSAIQFSIFSLRNGMLQKDYSFIYINSYKKPIVKRDLDKYVC